MVPEAADWLRTFGPGLASAEQPLVKANRFSLLHFDTRSDNIRIQGDLLRIFDWPWASVGPPEFDLGAFAQSIANEGGPDSESIAGWYSEVLPIDADVLTGSVVALGGYFADRGSRPELPGLPRLRAHQRRQMRVSLEWALRRLALPVPKWLEAVAD
jgi:aminoglycoside phosphotransferase (APT) family kinase protein